MPNITYSFKKEMDFAPKHAINALRPAAFLKGGLGNFVKEIRFFHRFIILCNL